MQKRRGDRMREIMISSTVMILLVMLFRVIFRGKVRHCLIYAMWLFVALRLLVPVNIGTFSFGVSGMMNQVQDHTENTKEIENDKMQEGSLNTLVLHKNTTTNSKMTVPEEKETPAQISAQEKMQEAWKAYKDKIWLAGTGSILLVVLVANIFYVHKLKKNRKSFDKFREGKLPVYVTENVQVPCLYGVFKTAIYLPVQRLDQLTEEQVKWIICHEECHYRQRDHIWSLLRILLTAVYWFHPLVWAAAYLSKKDAEISCDEKVLANSNLTQKIAYGKTLICVASRDRKLSVFYPTTAVVGTKKELKNRMRKIVEENKYKRKAKVVLAVIMATSVVFTFSGCGNVTQKDAQNSSATSDKIEKLQTTKNDNSKAVEQEKDTIKDDTKWNEKFTDFLKENQKKYKLFSVVAVGEKREPVLLVSKKQYASDVLDGLSGKIRTDVTETSEPMKIKTGADVYVLQGDEVKKIDSISCSSSGEWIHVNEGKVYVDTHHSLTGFEWNDGKWTSNEIAQKMDKDYENYDTEFAKQFFWNFEVADSVIFWNNTSKNRKKIETYAVRKNMEERVNNFIRKQIKEGRQAYIVCPLVEENEDMEGLQSVIELAERYQKETFSEYKVAYLHGKMKPKEKDEIMLKFKDGEIQILIATTVIEVGVNVPNASIMVVENAERFGLAQLHQLRGRVGRGEYQSYCILKYEGNGDTIRQRMKVMCDTNDGFVISEKDLELRGSGDFFGTEQHGLPEFKIANLFEDIGTLKKVQGLAIKIMEDDPLLEKEKNKKLNELVKEKFSSRIEI